MKTLEELQELAIKMNYTLEELMYEMLCDSVDDLDKLQTRIDKAIEYCEESSLTIKSHYFSDVLSILKGEDTDERV